MDDFIVASLGALLGAVFGAVSTIFVEAQKHRRDIAVSLFAEFNTPEILQLHADVEQILETHIRRKGLDQDPDSEITMLYLESNISSSDYIKVTSILHMFEKLVILYEHDRSDRKMMRELLGRHLKWWYQKYVRRFTSERPETAELLKIVKRMKRVAGVKEKLKEHP